MNQENRFKFASLDDAARVCSQLTSELESNQAMILGLQTFVCALMGTHHNHVQMQLVTTSYLEHILSIMPKEMLSDAQRDRTRSFVEGIQAAMKPTTMRPESSSTWRTSGE